MTEAAPLDAVPVAQLPGAVIAVDLEGRIRHWSPVRSGSTAGPREEAVGRSIREAHPARPGVPRRRGEGTHPRRRAVGRRVHRTAQGRPLARGVGEQRPADRRRPARVVGVVGVSLDMTAHAAAQAARSAELQGAHDRAERLADRQARLVQVSEALGRALTPAQVVEVVIGQGVEALGADAGGIAGVDVDVLRVLGAVGYEAEVAGTYEGLHLDTRQPADRRRRAGARRCSPVAAPSSPSAYPRPAALLAERVLRRHPARGGRPHRRRHGAVRRRAATPSPTRTSSSS